MEFKLETLDKSEQITYRLRDIYEHYGYGLFRMSKFEEYDFYMKNKDYLTGAQIIAFSDLNGKLLALKPDITLSIVKNTSASPGRPERVYYTESVYRVSKDVREYKELFQIGLEFIGRVTPYVNVELVTLAAESLACVAPDWMLDISHMGFLSGMLESLELPSGLQGGLRQCIEQKNTHGLYALMRAGGLPEGDIERLAALCRLSGRLDETLRAVKPLCANPVMERAVNELASIAEALRGTPMYARLNLDFSLANDTKYYNGLMLRGYINGIPRAILSGGRYDPLLRRMGKPELEAIGFALNCDEIARFYKRPALPEPDVVILYDNNSDLSALSRETRRRTALGQRVCVLEQKPENRRGETVKIEGTEAVVC